MTISKWIYIYDIYKIYIFYIKIYLYFTYTFVCIKSCNNDNIKTCLNKQSTASFTVYVQKQNKNEKGRSYQKKRKIK